MTYRDFCLALILGLAGAWLIIGRDLVRDYREAPPTPERQAVSDLVEPGRPLSASAAHQVATKCQREACK